MSESNLDPYHGVLNPFQIAAGLRAAKASAQRLLDDARHLYEIESYPSATALGVLCIEEIGKLPVLRRMALAKTAQEWRQCWRAVGQTAVDLFSKDLDGDAGSQLPEGAPKP